MTEKMVEIEIDIDDSEFLYVAKMAHERDITFNEMINHLIEWEIAERKKEERNGKSND